MWSHYNPVRLTVGVNAAAGLAPALSGLASAVLVTSPGMERRGAASALRDRVPGLRWIVYEAGPLPDLDALDGALAELRAAAGNAGAVVALGGGSVMDTAKALALALPCDEPAPLDAWLRRKTPRTRPGLPLFCLPSTAGTGAEVTPFATIWDNACKRKRSLAGDDVFPRAAFVDPAFTATLPERETLFGALDALSHALETLWNTTATPLSGAYALQALDLLLDALPGLTVHGTPLPAVRERLQLAALLAGLAISQSHTSLGHSMSYPLTLHFGVPHGLACSAFLDGLTELVEARRLWVINPCGARLQRLRAVFRSVQARNMLSAYCSAEQVYALCNEMGISERATTFPLPVDSNLLRAVLFKTD